MLDVYEADPDIKGVSRDAQYRQKMIVYIDDEDHDWNIEVPALRGCWAYGETLSEALEEIDRTKGEWIEQSLMDGNEFPESDIAREVTCEPHQRVIWYDFGQWFVQAMGSDPVNAPTAGQALKLSGFDISSRRI